MRKPDFVAYRNRHRLAQTSAQSDQCFAIQWKAYSRLERSGSVGRSLDHVCLVFFMLLRLFIAALGSPAGKGLTSWLLLVMFIVFLLLSHVVSWVRCDI